MDKHQHNNVPVTRRFIACTQSTGRIGKSTVADGLISWLRYAGIPFAAVDCDAEHKTLSSRHHGDVALFDATRSLDDFALLIDSLPDPPVIITDFPAQATGFLLSGATHFRLLDTFAVSGIRPTILIFASDDETAQRSAAETVSFFGDGADYLLVENLARFRSSEFKKTALYDWFTQRNTPTLEIPTITVVALNAWADAERKAARGISLDESVKASGPGFMAQFELEYIRNRFLVQFENYADRIVPDKSLIKNKVSHALASGKPSFSNPYTNPLLSKTKLKPVITPAKTTQNG